MLPPVEEETSKQCTMCKKYHDPEKVREVAVPAFGFYWWNCSCKNTLVLDMCAAEGAG
jgi:hypothetical protein